MSKEERKKSVDDLVEKIRKKSVAIWELAKVKLMEREQNRRYVCPTVIESVETLVDGAVLQGGRYFSLDNGDKIYGRTVFNFCFPEFLEKFNNSMPFTVKDYNKRGWFGYPNDENDKKRLDAMTEMIELYRYLDSIGLLIPDGEEI